MSRITALSPSKQRTIPLYVRSRIYFFHEIYSGENLTRIATRTYFFTRAKLASNFCHVIALQIRPIHTGSKGLMARIFLVNFLSAFINAFCVYNTKNTATRTLTLHLQHVKQISSRGEIARVREREREENHTETLRHKRHESRERTERRKRRTEVTTEGTESNSPIPSPN